MAIGSPQITRGSLLAVSSPLEMRYSPAMVGIPQAQLGAITPPKNYGHFLRSWTSGVKKRDAKDMDKQMNKK